MATETSNRKILGLFIGPFLFFLMLMLPTPEGLSIEGQRVAAVTLLMAAWWMSEAVPIPATALLPLALYPLLDIMNSKAVSSPYSDRIIFLFIGGFFLAVTMERWNLHRRIALHIIHLVGEQPARMVLGFMLASAFLSMWISNTATTMMLVPIGLAVIQQVLNLDSEQLREIAGSKSREYKFGVALMLGIAYAASIGGISTLIGTPPNVVLAGQIGELYKQEIAFLDWMLLGVPLAAVMLVITWIVLCKVLFNTGDMKLGKGREYIMAELEKLGPMTKPEKIILAVGSFMALSWIFKKPVQGLVKGILDKNPDSFLVPFKGILLVHDSTIAIFGALLLFCIPLNLRKSEFILDWKTAVKIPWDIVLLFGGGLALAKGFSKSGLAAWIASQLTTLEGVGVVMFVCIIVTMAIFLTELTSNTATATLLVPIMGATAIALGMHPYATIVSACIACSFAFMLPVATPPNAVVFGSGALTIPQMMKAGIWLNIIGIVLITIAVVVFMPLVWSIDLTTLPEWPNITG